MSNQQPPITTTDAGSPAPSDEHSLTVGPGGPNLLQDSYLNEKLAHFVRERIPDPVRFSIVAADEGAPDTDRDVRGVAIKFYTEEGGRQHRLATEPRRRELHSRARGQKLLVPDRPRSGSAGGQRPRFDGHALA
jgi:hypothetical protein